MHTGGFWKREGRTPAPFRPIPFSFSRNFTKIYQKVSCYSLDMETPSSSPHVQVILKPTLTYLKVLSRFSILMSNINVVWFSYKLFSVLKARTSLLFLLICLENISPFYGTTISDSSDAGQGFTKLEWIPSLACFILQITSGVTPTDLSAANGSQATLTHLLFQALLEVDLVSQTYRWSNGLNSGSLL